MWIIRKLDNIR